MCVQMIARVHVTCPPSSTTAPTPAEASSPPPLQTDMSLRVYTLSSLHTLLSSLSPWFSLEATYAYADIYHKGWNAAEEGCRLTYPYPIPSVQHLTKSSGDQAESNLTDSKTLLETSVAALSEPQRNWNRVFPVAPSVRDEWEDVEALLLVLRRRELDTSPLATSAQPL